MPGEPPTRGLNAALAARGVRVLLPITLPDLDLDWHAADDEDETPSAARRSTGRTSSSPPGWPSTAPAPGWARAAGATTAPSPAGARARRSSSSSTRASCSPTDEELLPRADHDQPVDAVVTAEGLVDLGVSPWRGPTPA